MSMNHFSVFPSERMDPEYPWTIWAVGWLAIFKAFLWLAYEPVQAESVLRLLGDKFLLNIIPLIILAIGVWNLKKWAAWGLIAISIANLIFFIVNPQTLNAVLVAIGSSHLLNYFVLHYLALQRAPWRYLHPLCSPQYAEAC